MTMNQLISEIKELNRSMVTLANESDWESLSVKSTSRQNLLETFFKQSESKTTPEEALQLTKLVTESDQQVNDILKKQRTSVIDSSLNLKNAQTALRAYRANQNHHEN